MNDDISWGYQDILLFLFLSLISILGCQLLMTVLAKALNLGAKDPAILLPTQLLLYVCIFTVLFASSSSNTGANSGPHSLGTTPKSAPVPPSSSDSPLP